MASRNKTDGRVRGEPLNPATRRSVQDGARRGPEGLRVRNGHRSLSRKPQRQERTRREAQSLLGMRIRTMRRAKGVPQDVLARQSGVCQSLLGQIERGHKNVRLVTVVLIANGLETTVADLFAGIA